MWETTQVMVQLKILLQKTPTPAPAMLALGVFFKCALVLVLRLAQPCALGCLEPSWASSGALTFGANSRIKWERLNEKLE
jgi:hypothetical protein